MRKKRAAALHGQICLFPSCALYSTKGFFEYTKNDNEDKYIYIYIKNTQYREQLELLNWPVKFYKIRHDTNRADQDMNSGICGHFGWKSRGHIEPLCVSVDCGRV